MEEKLDKKHQDLVDDVMAHDGEHSLLSDERGLTTVEYIIVLVLIAVVGFGLWQRFGRTVATHVGESSDVIDGLDTTVSEQTP
jgi:Flp pilus assembly pilin Flp